MTFLHPWAIFAGVSAIGLPVAVHFLTRPRPVRLPLSTLRFVREAVEQKRAAHRLRDWIILALRTLAVALIALAFARPLIGAKNVVGADTGGNVVRVVILDQSLSMAAGTSGVTAFERGRAVASAALAYQPGARGNLILAGAQPRPVFDRLTSNFDALREALAKAKPRTERLNIQPAINAAAELFASAGTRDATRKLDLVIVSDFQRGNFSSIDLSPLPKETSVRLESVAAKGALANVGIVRVGATGRIEQGGHVPVEVEVGNYSPAARNVDVELTIGAATYKLAGLCPPNVRTTLTTDVTLNDAGWQIGRAKLIGVEDALGADNERPFVLDVRPPSVYALVTRDSSVPRPTSSHFLERALVPTTPAPSDTGGAGANPRGERVVRIDPAHLDRDAVAGADLIVLDHPGRLSNESTNLLAALMRRGKAVLYVAAEPMDAGNLKSIADAAGSDLKMPVEFSPPAAGQARRELFLAEMRKTEPPFASFGERLAASVGPLRFGGGLSSRRLEGGLIDDVLAWYSDRSAALVVTACGGGTLAVLNADLNVSNLPKSPAFVPMLAELVNRMLGRGRVTDAAPCGETLSAYLPAEAGAAEGLTTLAPETQAKSDDKDDNGALADENGLVVWHWPSPGSAGAYRVMRGDKAVYALATAAPAVESDLQTIDPSLLTGRLAGGRTVEFHASGEDEQRNDTAWAWVLAVCAMCMIGEVGMLKLFRA
jgi:hypothetical protein